jgi:glycosyltransferase 2 family protein
VTTNAKRPLLERWRLPLTLLLTVVLLGLLVRQFAGVAEFVATVKSARLDLLLLAFALACVCLLLITLRWVQALAAIGHRVAFGRGLNAVLSAWPISVVIPSRAGDFARALMVRDSVPLLAGAGSVLVEKAIDIHTLLLAALVAGLSLGLRNESAFIGALLVVLWLVLLLVLRSRQRLLRLPFFRSHADKVEQLYRAFEVLLAHPGQILTISAISLAVRLLTVTIVHTLLAAVGVSIDFVRLVAAWLIATLAGLMPLTIGGMGTRDGAFMFLVNGQGRPAISEAQLLAATMGYSLFAVLSFALLGLPFLARSSLLRQSPALELKDP